MVKKTEAEKVAELKAAGYRLGKTTAGEVLVGSTCGRCGGSGGYPSGCIPPGRCRACYPAVGVIWRSVAKTYAAFKRGETAARKAAEREAARVAAEAAERAEHGGKTLREIAAEERAAAAAAKEAERLAELAKSEFLGEVGERIELEATVEHVAHYEGRFGPGAVVMLRSGPHAIRWFTGSPGELGRPEAKGKAFKIAGTVKKHESYREERMTHLTRVKVVAEVEAPAEEPAPPEVVKAAPPKCTIGKHRGHKEGLYDVAGIFVAYVCSYCEAEVRARYRPGIFEESLSDYYRHAAEHGERVEADY